MGFSAAIPCACSRTLGFLALALTFVLSGCGGGSGTAPPPPPPPPPPAIVVTVTPTSSSILLGNLQTFTASVANSANTGVTWSVNGVSNGNSATGTITSAGVYTAPTDLPSPTAVTVTATSQADSTKSASAQVTITSDITVTLSPSTSGIALGSTVPFHAAINSAGHPNAAVLWSLSGAACPAACGAVDSSGNYTAPQILPSPAKAVLTAQSVADPSKQATASITINSSFTLQVSGPQVVTAGGTASIVATLTAGAGSKPDTNLTWFVTGPGCTQTTCGTLTVVTSQASGGSVTSDTATYTAPGTPPNPNTVTVLVTPQADPTKEAQTMLSIQAGVSVSISPATDTLAANHRVTFTAQVFGSTNPTLNWSVNGIAGGNSAVGQICVVGSSPCQQISGSAPLVVDYLAPGAIPQPNPVSVMATSAADTTKSASAQITVINHVLVSVQPQSMTLAPLSVQAFSSSVLGTANQAVTWQVQGTPCATAGVCGVVDSNGIYTAPGVPPSPDALQVVAISQDDSTQSGSANVTISSGSIMMIGGTARTTTCLNTTQCTAPVTATDVSVAGNVSVQVDNPSGSVSNLVSLVVAAPNAANATISLTSAAPAVTGEDIVVVEPTTAGVSAQGSDVDLNVAALGMFSVASNSCSLSGSPLSLQRPASGNSSFDICVFSNSGLDASMTYTVSGPGDISVIAKQPAGLGIIHLTIQVPASASAGARTLFIQNTNLDETAATGALVIQ